MEIENSIYIADPMTGIDAFNYPSFHAAAKKLRAKGWTVISPAELHRKRQKKGTPWEWYMRRDIAALVTCKNIYMLRGWEKSRGAQLELHIAKSLGMVVLYEIGDSYSWNSGDLMFAMIGGL